MRSIDVVKRTKLSRSMRVRQIESAFDVPPGDEQELRWTAQLPIDEFDWNVGLIVGASGSGKTTIARELFGVDAVDRVYRWDGLSIIDDFPKTATVEELAAVCQAVGFNTIPAWLRPYSVLSNGEKFRATLARALVEDADPIVIDEFTSTVDRQVAKIASFAVQKYVRKQKRKLVAVTCHYDVEDWLSPDWVFDVPTRSFTRRELRQRPSVSVEIARVPYAVWDVFAPFHYLTRELHRSAKCFGLWVDGRLAAFCGVIHHPIPSGESSTRIWKSSRLVTLPDFQGLGLAFVLVDAIGSAYRSLSCKFRCYPAHPALVRAFDRSRAWKLITRPGKVGVFGKKETYGQSGGLSRPCAVFEYAGPAMTDCARAREFLDSKPVV